MESALSSLDTRVEAFAALIARLEAPFADRAAVLQGAGLDQAQYLALKARWSARFANESDAAELARRFGDAYEQARSGAAAPGGPEAAAPQNGPGLEPEAARSPLSEPLHAAPPAPEPPPVIAAAPAAYITTGEVNLSAILKKAVPFDPAAKPGVEPSIKEAPPAARKTPLSGNTAEVDIAAMARRALAFGAPAAKPPAPPAADAPRPPPELTLDQYALLAAEMVLVNNEPTARAAVLARFGVDNIDALTAAWRARFAADPAISERWNALYAQHYARLSAERARR